MSEINALEHLVERERSYCWMFGDHMDDPCPCGWASKDSAYSQLVALKTEIVDLHAEADEMRETLVHMTEYILSTSSASLRADAFQKYPKAGKMFREIEGLLKKYPKE